MRTALLISKKKVIVLYHEDNYSSRTLHVPAGTADVFHDSDWSDYFGKIVEM